jgi:hypothetical protein
MNARSILLSVAAPESHDFQMEDTMTITWKMNFIVVEYLLQSEELFVIIGNLLHFSWRDRREWNSSSELLRTSPETCCLISFQRLIRLWGFRAKQEVDEEWGLCRGSGAGSWDRKTAGRAKASSLNTVTPATCLTLIPSSICEEFSNNALSSGLCSLLLSLE